LGDAVVQHLKIANFYLNELAPQRASVGAGLRPAPATEPCRTTENLPGQFLIPVQEALGA
jgi:hypothetical protein